MTRELWASGGLDLAALGIAPTLWALATHRPLTAVLLAGQAALSAATLGAYVATAETRPAR